CSAPGSDTIVTTTSAPHAASAGLSARVAPSSASVVALAGSRFQTTSSFPPSRRRRAMRLPIAPSPTTATLFTGGILADDRRASLSRLLAMTYMQRLAVAWAINAAALWAANGLWDGVRIHGWAAYLIGSAVLGVANTIIKPVLAVLTLPLIVITLGFFYLVINIAMVALAEWAAPRFSIDGFWSYVGV